MSFVNLNVSRFLSASVAQFGKRDGQQYAMFHFSIWSVWFDSMWCTYIHFGLSEGDENRVVLYILINRNVFCGSTTSLNKHILMG